MAKEKFERSALISRANILGVSFPKNIGTEKLAKRIEEFEADTKPEKGEHGATDDGSQPQTGAAPEAAPTNPVTRTQGGGLPEAHGATAQTDTNTPPDPAGTTGAAETAAGPETPEAGEGGEAGNDDLNPESLSGAKVSIVGPKRGRWRAGRHFTAEPTVIPVDDLTEDEIVAITLDDKLTVTPVE